MTNLLPVLLTLALIQPSFAFGGRSIPLKMVNSVRMNLQGASHPMVMPIAQRMLKQKEFSTAQFSAMAAVGLHTLDDLRSPQNAKAIGTLISQGIVSEPALMGLQAQLQAVEPDLIKAGALEGEINSEVFSQSLAERAGEANAKAGEMFFKGYHNMRRLGVSEREKFAANLKNFFREKSAILTDENRQRYKEIVEHVEFMGINAVKNAKIDAQTLQEDGPGTIETDWMERSLAASGKEVRGKEAASPQRSGLAPAPKPSGLRPESFYPELRNNFIAFVPGFARFLGEAGYQEYLMEKIRDMEAYLDLINDPNKRGSTDSVKSSLRNYGMPILPLVEAYSAKLPEGGEKTAVVAFVNRFKQLAQ